MSTLRPNTQSHASICTRSETYKFGFSLRLHISTFVYHHSNTLLGCDVANGLQCSVCRHV